MTGVLSQPFLLEKMTLELPFMAGPGWMNDRTILNDEVARDMGGPCITFGLFRQESDTLRELILSGCIIPTDDNNSFIFDEITGLSANTGGGGFLSFGTPTAIVNPIDPASSLEYTGSVTLNMRATVANGVFVASASIFIDSRIRRINTFGRGNNARASGRSFFGKEFTIPSIAEVERLEPAGAEFPSFRFEQSTYSPYLLFPDDNLILTLTKHRPVATAAQVPEILTGSHDVVITTGTLRVRMYGSLVQGEQEFHETVNQLLTSLAVHEDIHGDNPIVDQFDVEILSSFSGTYVDDFITGSIFETGSIAAGRDGRRGVRLSAVGSTERSDTVPLTNSVSIEIPISPPSLLRGIKLVSATERFFDTLLPRPDKIIKQNGGDIAHFTSVPIRNVFPIGRIEDAVQGFTNYAFDTNWDFLFPFEPKYAGIERTTTPFRDTASTKRSNGDDLEVLLNNTSVIRPESSGNQAGPDVDSTWVLLDFVPQDTGVTRQNVIASDFRLAKALFGTGDGQYGEPISTPVTQASAGSHSDTLIRGWKYGLLSGTPLRRSYVFRRDRFGQIRDMLEQSHDSKFFFEDSATTQISPIKVVFTTVDGEQSFSSNVSNEATSSLPYFDGEARNRGPLPATEFIP